MRNEEFYIPVLDAMLASPVLEEIEKVRPKARRELAQKNRIGTKALNFNYTLASGAQVLFINKNRTIPYYLSITRDAMPARRQSKH